MNNLNRPVLRGNVHLGNPERNRYEIETEMREREGGVEWREGERRVTCGASRTAWTTSTGDDIHLGNLGERLA